MRKIRVLVNAVPLKNVKTGIGRYIESLYQVMERKYKDEFEFLYFDGVQATTTMPDGPDNPARWNFLVKCFWKLPSSISFILRLYLHSRAEKRFKSAVAEVDVYHETAFFPYLAPDNVAILFTIHDLSLIRHPQWHPEERVKYFSHFFPSRVKSADAFTSVSEFSKSEIQALTAVSGEQITVTPLSYDRDCFFERLPEAVTTVRQKFGLSSSYFLFVGTNDPRKNIDVILQALSREVVKSPLVIIGWSGWGDKLPENIIGLGYVSDEELACLYSGATALVYPSVYEGFGLPVVEAMACGCPVVVTREASLPEVAGGAGCYLSSVDDAEGLAEFMVKLECDDAYREQKRQEVIKQAGRFSWEVTAERTREALHDALEERRKRVICSSS